MHSLSTESTTPFDNPTESTKQQLPKQEWQALPWSPHLLNPLRAAMTRLNQEVPASNYCVQLTEEIVRLNRMACDAPLCTRTTELGAAANELRMLLNKMQ